MSWTPIIDHAATGYHEPLAIYQPAADGLSGQEQADAPSKSHHLDCGNQGHSGTGLDLPFTWDPRRGMWREAVNPTLGSGLVAGLASSDSSGFMFL